MVSCHRKIVDHCLERGRKILMLVEHPYGLYEFDANNLKGAYLNKRNGVEMVNFLIDSGKRREMPGEQDDWPTIEKKEPVIEPVRLF